MVLLRTLGCLFLLCYFKEFVTYTFNPTVYVRKMELCISQSVSVCYPIVCFLILCSQKVKLTLNPKVLLVSGHPSWPSLRIWKLPLWFCLLLSSLCLCHRCVGGTCRRECHILIVPVCLHGMCNFWDMWHSSCLIICQVACYPTFRDSPRWYW